MGGQLSYSYDTRRVAVSGQVEHYERDFSMDTAFVNRVGVTRAWQYQGLSFYPDEKRYRWIKRVNPFLWVMAADDQIQGGSELWVIPAIAFQLHPPGLSAAGCDARPRDVRARRFEVGRVFADGGAQITRWLSFGGNVNNGPAVFYDQSIRFRETGARSARASDCSPIRS